MEKLGCLSLHYITNIMIRTGNFRYKKTPNITHARHAYK